MGFLFGPPQTDNTVQNLMQDEANAARAAEAERQGKIRSGTDSINNQFSGFGDNFYKQYQDANLNYYQPQLDDKFKQAKEDLTFSFARAGTDKSTMAADRLGDLTKQYDLQKAGLVSQALSGANQLKANVSNQKSNLLSQLNATADATQAANDATSATQQIYAYRPEYSPLGDLFSGLLGGIGNTIGANQSASYNQAYFQPGAKGATRTVKS